MENVAGAAGAVLGYIHNNGRGAVAGYRLGATLARMRTNPVTPPTTPFRRVPGVRFQPYPADSTPLSQRLLNRLRNRIQSLTGTVNTYPNRIQMAVKRRSKTMKRKRGGKKSLTSSIVKAIRKQEPAKHWTGTISANLLHSNIYCFNATGGITQGTSNAQRDGDSIRLEALKLKGFVQTTTAAKAYTYRVIVGYTGLEYAGVNTNLGLAGAGVNDLFQPNTTTGWVPNGVINAKAVTVIADYTVDVPSLITGVEDICSIDMLVPLNTKFPYQAGAATYGKFKNLVVWVTSGVVGGSSGVTATGVTYMGYDLIFKNE